MKSGFCIYVIFRPNGVPCYVGKGSTNRWKRHARKSHNPHLARIIANAGGELPVVKIREGLTESEAFAIEVTFIAAIGRKKHGGPLVNLTDSGEGATGKIMSDAAKEAIRAAHKGRPKSEKHKAVLRGPRGPMKPEYKAAISARQIGKKHSPDWNTAIGRGNRNSPNNAARCKAIGDAQRGIPKGPCTESRRLAVRAAMLAHHATKRAIQAQEQ